MSELQKYIDKIAMTDFYKMIISNPVSKSNEYKKIIVEEKESGYQIAKYTQKQVFHENLNKEAVTSRLYQLIEGAYRQVNAFSKEGEQIILISKKGSPTYKEKKKQADTGSKPTTLDHNRKKNYILGEGQIIPPLVDMGIFTKEGKVVNAMYDKYRQINRFLEILNDEISKRELKQLNVIDFGCGKSYLTFVVYYYLTQVMGIDAHIIGLDLKADVIEKCNRAAQKYNYDNLHFELGDINGYKAPFDVDMVITLHACDTATDFALYNAIQWKAKMIFSVPCCQHELNKQMKPKTQTIMSRYGIVKERFAALATDAIRGNLLEYMGYRAQLLEFIDFDHTPKNILIRAVRQPVMPKGVREKALSEIDALIEEFGFEPTLYQLLIKTENGSETR